MPIGAMDKYVAIQEVTESLDGRRQVVQVWSTAVQVWAAIYPAGGGERYISRQVHAEASHTLRMYARSGLTAKMRILYKERVFDIKLVRPETKEGGMFMLVDCLERLP